MMRASEKIAAARPEWHRWCFDLIDRWTGRPLPDEFVAWLDPICGENKKLWSGDGQEKVTTLARILLRDFAHAVPLMVAQVGTLLGTDEVPLSARHKEGVHVLECFPMHDHGNGHKSVRTPETLGFIIGMSAQAVGAAIGLAKKTQQQQKEQAA